MHIWIYPTTEKALYDIGLMLFEALTLNSIQVSISLEPSKTDTNVVLGGHVCGNFNLIPSNSIIFNLEHLYPGSPWLNDFYKVLLKKYQVWDFSEKNLAYLASNLNVTSAKMVTFGFSNLLKTIPSLLPEEEHIDVLFYGGVLGRRKEYIDAILKAGIKLVVGSNSFWGKTKSEMISRSKIVLNIHLYNGGFEVPRVYHLLNNKRFVISETSINDYEYTSIADGFVRVQMDNIPAMIEEIKYYLSRGSERREIADTGYRLIKNIKTLIPT